MSYITIINDDEEIPMKFGESTIMRRRYSTAVHNDLEKKHRKRRKNRQGEVYYEVDDIGMNNAVIDHVIAELINVSDGKGGFVETTLANKLRLPGEVVAEVMEQSGAASLIRGSEDPDPTITISKDI